MKIAVPTTGSMVDEYFKSCEVFTIFSIDESSEIIDSEILCTPEGCDCKNNIPLIMQEKGITVMLAFKLPEHGEEICSQHGIKVYLEYSGNVRKVAETFLLEKKYQIKT